MKRSRLKDSAGSYLSSHDPREVIRLGTATKLDWLEIRWPGPAPRLTDLLLYRYTTITEGSWRIAVPRQKPEPFRVD